MKLLVTGGAGFIGSCFIRMLAKVRPAYTILNIDKLTYAGNVENLETIDGHENYHFICGDICDRALVQQSIRHYGIEAVIHFAAESHVDRSIQDSYAFMKTNILGTHQLLELTRELKLKRFVQVSTDEVYGSLAANGYFTEQSLLAPNSPYAASKTSADLLVRAYFKTYKLPVMITRCSNNYGPYQYPEKLIPLFIIRALENKPLPVYGDGLYVRDWIHTEDHCRALLEVLERGKEGEVYNIGARCEKTNLDIAHRILDILKKPRSLLQTVEDRPGHDRRYAIDPTKIERELGWRPQFHLDDELPQLIEWYQKHEVWWKKLIH